MILASDIIVIQTPAKALVFRSAQNKLQFFILPLEPSIAEDGGRLSLQFMMVEKNDVTHLASLSVTTTLPLDSNMRRQSLRTIIDTYDDITDTDNVVLIRADTQECKVSMVFGKDPTLSLEGTFQGIGEQRVLMQKTLTPDQAQSLLVLWNDGLPEAFIHYSTSISVAQKSNANYIQSDFQEILGANHLSQNSRTKHVDVTEYVNDLLILNFTAPISISQRALSKALIKTTL